MAHDRGKETNYRLTSCLCAPMIGYRLENDLLKNIRPDSRMEKFCTRFILGNLEVSRNQCSDTGGSVDIAPGGESSSCCLEPIVSIDFIKNRTLSSEDGPLSMSTGCGPMSRLHWLPFVDPFSMSSGPYRAASLF
ncbi:hypothetical protein F2Q69_00007470 [Brassica cretica]|uniref:Uncharacterized protein n=1 Tax=Brassica cretica TaxID=69181 RepID=A0A8S9P324_BRACR|nr:hypothetical protein F2Q69_00007470 [Brassica cretica]